MHTLFPLDLFRLVALGLKETLLFQCFAQVQLLWFAPRTPEIGVLLSFLLHVLHVGSQLILYEAGGNSGGMARSLAYYLFTCCVSFS
jgi:hypothetical protein